MYRPTEPLPSENGGMGPLVRWLVREFRKLSQVWDGSRDFIRLNELHAPPARIYEDMVVKADGADWNPGGGAGIYARVSGAWVKLN